MKLIIVKIILEKAWWNTSTEPGIIRNPYAPTPSKEQNKTYITD